MQHYYNCNPGISFDKTVKNHEKPHFAIAGVPAQIRTALRWDESHRRHSIKNVIHPSGILNYISCIFLPQPFFFTLKQVV